MKNVVFFGSSVVDGIGASSTAKRFTSIASRTLGWNEINRGRSGSTVTGRDEEGQIIDEDSGLSRVPEVLEAGPDLVVIAFDADDYRASRELGEIGSFRQGTFCSDFDTILRGLLYSLSAAQITLSTTLRPPGLDTPNKTGLTPLDYDRIIRILADKHDIRMLDPFHEAGLAPAEWTAIRGKGPCPNDAGHECLAAYFIQEMHDGA